MRSASSCAEWTRPERGGAGGVTVRRGAHGTPRRLLRSMSSMPLLSVRSTAFATAV